MVIYPKFGSARHLLPHAPDHEHCTRFLEAGDALSEGFVCSDAMDSASAVYAWVLICLSVECAGALGWWLL